jgi:hypothetical protein
MRNQLVGVGLLDPLVNYVHEALVERHAQLRAQTRLASLHKKLMP